MLLACWVGAGCSPALVWHTAHDLNPGLPLGIEVFRGSGDGLQGVYARLDQNANPALAWRVALAAPGAQGMTPLAFSQSLPRQPYVVVNGGFFDASNSMSLAVVDGMVRAAGVKRLSRQGQQFYPARAAFGQFESGRAEARWVSVAGEPPVLSAFTQAPGTTGGAPSAPPAGGVPWHPQTAIGAGPMLVSRGVKRVTAMQELFDAASGVGVTQRAPRTALAVRADGALLFIVIDGRSSHSRGATLDELADMLVALGAWDAINLDGGGSSAMVVNGAVINRPSDAAGQRRVRSVLMLTAR